MREDFDTQQARQGKIVTRNKCCKTTFRVFLGLYIALNAGMLVIYYTCTSEALFWPMFVLCPTAIPLVVAYIASFRSSKYGPGAKSFFIHFWSYVFLNGMLVWLWYSVNVDASMDSFWPVYPLFGWGMFLGIHFSWGVYNDTKTSVFLTILSIFAGVAGMSYFGWIMSGTDFQWFWFPVGAISAVLLSVFCGIGGCKHVKIFKGIHCGTSVRYKDPEGYQQYPQQMQAGYPNEVIPTGYPQPAYPVPQVPQQQYPQQQYQQQQYPQGEQYVPQVVPPDQFPQQQLYPQVGGEYMQQFQGTN